MAPKYIFSRSKYKIMHKIMHLRVKTILALGISCVAGDERGYTTVRLVEVYDAL